MMNEEMSMMVFGFPLDIVMFASALFYLVCAAIIWKPFREEKNELIGALFAFLVYQALAMFFMGMEMSTMKMIYANLSGLAILIGSAYMLKFPFARFSEGTRKMLFALSLLVVLSLFVWFVSSPSREMMFGHFAIWYDVVVNGIVVGFFMLFVGLRAKESWLRIKAIGGGTGVASCCVVANIAMLGGALAVSSVFQFSAPIIIIASIVAGRKKQNRALPPIA